MGQKELMSNLALGSVRDQHLDYVLKRVFLPAQSAVNTQITGASTVLSSGFAAVPVYAQLGSTLVGALKFAAVTEHANLTWQLPYDFDNRHRLLIRHLWTSGYATASGTATFTTVFNTLSVGSAATAPATVLTKTHGASTKVSATANTVYWTPYGYIAPIATGAGANSTFSDGAEVLVFDICPTAVGGLTIASDFIYWLGMELAYTPSMTFGDGSRREARQVGRNLDHITQQIAANQV